jgi:NADPH2:quinone reductase
LLPGAAGGVACALTQVARSRGIRVIGTASTPEKARYALANGVSDIVTRDAALLPAEVMALTEGRGVDLAFDHLGGDSLIACIRSLAPLGMAVSYNVVNGPPSADVFQELRSLLGRSLALRVFSMHSFDQIADVRRALMESAISQMASGAVTAAPAQLLSFAEIQKAHAWLDAGTSMGKIVIQP